MHYNRVKIALHSVGGKRAGSGSRADSRLSNLIYQGGKSKSYGDRSMINQQRDNLLSMLSDMIAERDRLLAERDRLKHLHALDHSLADQWQTKNIALEADNAALRARAERAEAALRDYGRENNWDVAYDDGAHFKDWWIGAGNGWEVAQDALAAPPEATEAVGAGE
jgi:hypothetical protein